MADALARRAGPGPADRRMYVANPVEPKAPYGYPDLPPYPGPLRPPASPGPTATSTT